MNQEEIYRTMVNIIGAMYAKKDSDITQNNYYKQAKEYYDNKQYELLLIYSIALIDTGDEIKFISPQLTKWQKRVKELKDKHYNAFSIADIMSEEL